MRGDANDYVGKSLHGGRIRILPGADSEGRFALDDGFAPSFNPSDCSIVGNTCLYGATGGKFFGLTLTLTLTRTLTLTLTLTLPRRAA